MSNESREIETLREMKRNSRNKNTVTEIMNVFDGLICRLDTAKQIIELFKVGEIKKKKNFRLKFKKIKRITLLLKLLSRIVGQFQTVKHTCN